MEDGIAGEPRVVTSAADEASASAAAASADRESVTAARFAAQRPPPTIHSEARGPARAPPSPPSSS